jgi:hypothetical protein
VFYCTYLFQENKSNGSKKQFAFILWRIRSGVGHRYSINERGGTIYKGEKVPTAGREQDT